MLILLHHGMLSWLLVRLRACRKRASACSRLAKEHVMHQFLERVSLRIHILTSFLGVAAFRIVVLPTEIRSFGYEGRFDNINHVCVPRG